MSSAKPFLIKFAVVYAIGAVLGLVLLGPPGLSSAYEEAYGHEHEHYLEIIKNEHYKLHEQNPEAHPADEHLAEQIAFVEEYEANEEYQAEQTRQFWFNLYFEVFNGLALVILAVRFGKAPLLRFLDERIAEVRTRIETAEQSRKQAAAELEQAADQIARLDDERSQIADQSATLAESSASEIRSSTSTIIAQLEKEGEQREQVEADNAATRMKRELVTLAMTRFEEQLRADGSDDIQEALFEQFVRDLEAAK